MLLLIYRLGSLIDNEASWHIPWTEGHSHTCRSRDSKRDMQMAVVFYQNPRTPGGVSTLALRFV